MARERDADVRVRPIEDDEALLLGALHLQVARRAGEEPDSGPPTHVQRFAQAWHRRAADLPAWVAELDGQHVGLALLRRPLLPHLDGRPEVLVLAALDAAGDQEEAVCLALARRVVAWARDGGAEAVWVAPEVVLPAPVLDGMRAQVHDRRRVSLPTRP